MILDVYYKIWVDGIVRLRSRPQNKGMWKFYAMTFISMAMAINILLFMVILQQYILKRWFWNFDVKAFGSSRLNDFASFFVLFLLIPLVINYLLIFRNNRYEQLINRYKYYNGKLCATYLMISYFLPFVLAAVAFLSGAK